MASLFNHESSNAGLVRSIAQYDAGRVFRDFEEAREHYKAQPWSKFLTIVTLEESVSIEEEAERILQEGYEAVVWDYLSGTMVRTHNAAALSPYSAIVQHIGQTIGKAGIPFYTASQAAKPNEHIPPTWVEKASVHLELHATERTADDDIRNTFRVQKNKIGRAHRGDYFDMYFDGDTRKMLYATKIDAAVVRQRDQDARKTKKQLDKESKEDE